MLFKLLGAPITLPAAGMKFIFEQIADMADRELNDEGALRDQLLLLQLQLEEGDIDEEEFATREAELVERLRAFAQPPIEGTTEGRRRVIIETPFDE
jgi:hypothetical protein